MRFSRCFTANFEFMRRLYRKINTETLLFFFLAGAFFSMPLGTSPLTICAILGASVWVFSGKVAQAKQIVNNTWVWPVLLFIVLPWVGLLYTPDPKGLGLDYAGKTHYWIYCMAVASISSGPLLPQRLIQAFLLGLSLNAFVAVLQFANVFPTSCCGEFRGLGEDYSILSAYLVVGMLMASHYFREAKDNRTRILLSLLMMLFFFHLTIMKGRAGYVTFVLLSPLIVHNLFKTSSLFKSSFACVLLCAMMFFSPVVRDRVSLSIDQLKYHLKADPNVAWGKVYTEKQDRFYMWYGAIPIFLENPFFGTGTGGYQTVMKESGKPDDPEIAHPHNNLAYMAVSFGIIGIMAYFWLFGEIMRNVWGQRHTPVGFFVLSVALVIFTSGLFNTTVLDAGTLFLLAVSVGFQQCFPKFAKSMSREA